MVKNGVAAQHYPPGWTNEKRNINELRKIAKGDKIIAAFKGHRFGGYDEITSEFYRGGESLKIFNQDGKKELNFEERFNCSWVVLPLSREQKYIRCSELKNKGYQIDLTRGLCVKEINENTFLAIKKILDYNGAKEILSNEVDERTENNGLESVKELDEHIEGNKVLVLTNRYERNNIARQKCLEHYGYSCFICGFNFEKFYGEIGRGFIHVHHLVSIASIDRDYKINPINDLRPVCPNCHAMLHRGEITISIEELKNKIKLI